MILIYLARQGKLTWLQGVLPQPVYIGRRCASEVQYFRRGKVKTPIDLAPLIDAGVLAVTEIQDKELPAYVGVVQLGKGLGEETEGMALARCRGWRFVTTDKKATAFARAVMPDIPLLHLSELLMELVEMKALEINEVEEFLTHAMPGY